MLNRSQNPEKYENPRTVKYADRQLLNVAAYNAKHFAGAMPESTLLKLLVEQGMTLEPLTDETLSARLAALGYKPQPAIKTPKKGTK